jgi:pimeloyl-ACP methyl ester carboxylesterase
VTAFVLVPGAGGQAWYWHLVIAELARAGYQARPVDLPGTDPAAGLETYRDAIVASAAALEQPVTVVAQSLAGFSAPLACGRVPMERLVLVNAMIPLPARRRASGGTTWAGKPRLRPPPSKTAVRPSTSMISTPCSSTTCRQN